MDKPKNSKILLIALATLLALMAGFMALQGTFGDLDQRFVRYERLESAPTFNLPLLKVVEPASLSGKSVLALNELHGKPVLLHFWASWCAACRDERPMLDELINQHHDGSLRIIGIASYDTAAALRSSGSLADAGFTVALDEDGDTALLYKVRALPQSVLIDGQGRIRYRVKGVLTLNEIGAVEAILLNLQEEERRAKSGQEADVGSRESATALWSRLDHG